MSSGSSLSFHSQERRTFRLRLKRKRQRRALFEDDTPPQFQVAPIADLLFVLLVFFMSITSLQVSHPRKGLSLPTVSEAPPGAGTEKAHQLAITVQWRPGPRTAALEAEGRSYSTPASLLPLLTARLAQDRSIRVVIRADCQVEYNTIAALMQTCSQARIGQVTFAVVNSPTHPKKPRP